MRTVCVVEANAGEAVSRNSAHLITRWPAHEVPEDVNSTAALERHFLSLGLAETGSAFSVLREIQAGSSAVTVWVRPSEACLRNDGSLIYLRIDRPSGKRKCTQGPEDEFPVKRSKVAEDEMFLTAAIRVCAMRTVCVVEANAGEAVSTNPADLIRWPSHEVPEDVNSTAALERHFLSLGLAETGSAFSVLREIQAGSSAVTVWVRPSEACLRNDGSLIYLRIDRPSGKRKGTQRPEDEFPVKRSKVAEDEMFLTELLGHNKVKASLRVQNRLKQLPYLPFFKDVPGNEPGDAEGDDDGDEQGDVRQESETEWQVYDFKDAICMQAFWGRGTRRTKIIERKCYVDLWKDHLCPGFLNNPDKSAAFLVLGSPGFGKSAFLLYVLIQLLDLKKRVLLRSEGGEYLLFAPDASGKYTCAILGDWTARLELRAPDVFFLVDGKLNPVPMYCQANMLCCTRLKENCKDERVRTLYMPPWSAEELALARQEMFEGFSLETVQERYNEWGGNPRFVLEKPRLQLAPVVSAVWDIETRVQELDALFQMQVEVGYENFRYIFSSPYVEAGVFEKLYAQQRDSLRRFIAFEGCAIGGYQALKGFLLERFFKTDASRTASYRVREVFEDHPDQGPDEVRVFQFGQLIEPDNLQALELPAEPERYNKLYWPKSKGTQSVECFTITRGNDGEADKLDMFQVAVSHRRNAHGLKYKGILDVMEKCGIQAQDTRVHIVVLPESFPNAGYQNWRVSNNKVLKSQPLRARLSGIRQYAMACNWV